MTEPTPEPSIALDFLERLYTGCRPDGWVTLFCLNRATGERRTEWAPVDNLTPLADIADARPDWCIWFGVATRRQRLDAGRRGGITDCAQVPALWVDLDVQGPNHGRDDLPPDLDAAHTLLDDYPCRPTVTVATGGGLQAWWLLDEPAGAVDAQPLLDQWGATWIELGRRRGWHVDSVFNVDRVMRLPGTYNMKGTA